MDLSKYSDETRAALREAYVGNECDTDEYGETQPAKCLGMVADLVRRLQDAGGDVVAVMGEIALWARECDGERYGGAEEARALYGRYFDLLWEAGEHPYYNDEAELDEWIDILER